MSTLDAGQLAPGFTLPLLPGGETSLARILSNGPVLLAFYKVTCPTCQLTLPFLERLRGGGLQVMAVCQDSAEGASEFNEAFGVDLPTLLDSDEAGYAVSNAYGITHVPSLFLVEPDGLISWAWVGFHKRQLEELAARAGRVMFRPDERVPEAKAG